MIRHNIQRGTGQYIRELDISSIIDSPEVTVCHNRIERVVRSPPKQALKLANPALLHLYAGAGCLREGLRCCEACSRHFYRISIHIYATGHSISALACHALEVALDKLHSSEPRVVPPGSYCLHHRPSFLPIFLSSTCLPASIR